MTKVRGQKDGDLLTASFDGVAKKAFPALNQTKVLLLLSIQGNSFCCKEFLEATVKNALLAHQQTTLLVADEVYWHNLKITADPTDEEKKALKTEALQLGNDYLEDNMPFIFDGLELSYQDFVAYHPDLKGDSLVDATNQWFKEKGLHVEVVRWNQWVNNQWPDYAHVKQTLYDYYDQSPLLQQSIAQTAHDFSRRHQKEGDSSLWEMRSQGYLREESPAVMWLAAKLGFQFIAYPGEKIAPFQMTQSLFINPTPNNSVPASLRISVNKATDLVNWLQINFKRGQSKKPRPEMTQAPSPAIFSGFFKPQQQLSLQQTKLLESIQQVINSLGIFANENMSPINKLDWMINALEKVKETISQVENHAVEGQALQTPTTHL